MVLVVVLAFVFVRFVVTGSNSRACDCSFVFWVGAQPELGLLLFL